MPELAVPTPTFCITLDFLQQGFWKRVILLQDWGRQYRCYVVVIMNMWIVKVCASTPWKPICPTCHSFPFPFHVPRTWLRQNTADVPRKAAVAYNISATGLYFYWSPSFSFNFVALYVLIWLFYVFFPVVCVSFPRLVFISGFHILISLIIRSQYHRFILPFVNPIRQKMICIDCFFLIWNTSNWHVS